MRIELANRRTALYRLYDAEGDLLYVGIAHDVEKRLTTHRLEKTWWLLVARISVEWFDSRALATAAEARAIESESPRFDATNIKNRGFWTRGWYEDPRAAEIEAALVADIKAGRFPAGKMLPRSPELADLYGAAPATIFHIMARLKQDHVVEACGHWYRR